MNSIQNISIQNHIHYIYNNILKYRSLSNYSFSDYIKQIQFYLCIVWLPFHFNTEQCFVILNGNPNG